MNRSLTRTVAAGDGKHGPLPRPVAAAAAIVLALGTLSTSATPELKFNRDIRPILSENCYQCHGPDSSARKAGLRLDLRDNTLKEHKGITPIVPGNPDQSEVIRRVTHPDPEERMPPEDSERKVNPEQIERIRQWIEEGAEYEPLWSFTPPTRPKRTKVKNSNWPRNPIDRFILSRLEKEGLTPAPEAEPVTIIRRLTFDLTGLPPSEDQFKEFLSGNTYETFVDELLASPHYGERMAVFWLDLVRFADTMGFHSDDMWRIYPYRDYVINAFNKNKPFDQFTREQIAGDLLENPSDEQVIASGYNRLNPVTGEGGAQAKEYITKYASDRVRTTSAVWMAATMGCAECHDHKFDPYTTKDFYNFAAFFADLEQRGLYSGGPRSTGIFPPTIRLAKDEEEERFERLDEAIKTFEGKLKAARNEKNKDLEKTIRKDLDQRKKEKRTLENKIPISMISKSVEPMIIRVLPRGNWLDESGAIANPAVPAFLGKITKQGPLSRLDLANWLVAKENPLTARTFVNRLWKLYFGKGISAVLDDLGSQGEWPVHPDVLDWLAVEFMESGWDIKHMIKLIVTSSAYRQSSVASKELRERDPYNRLIARQTPIRLDAEMVRDTALAVSGLLNRQIGGKSVKPYQPDGYWSDSYKSVGRPHIYVQDHGAELYRRGLYTFWKRTFLHPSLLAFDASPREECTAERPVSNTPLQALVLLNDPTYVEAARVFAENIIRNGGSDFVERINWAFRRALTRTIREEEAVVFSRLFDKHKTYFARNPEDAKALIATGEYKVPEELNPSELATWTSITRTLFNLHEFIVRN